MNDFFLNSKTPYEINLDIANRLKMIRKKKGLSQVKLSQVSGVSLGSIKRFESKGDISLISLTKISIALEVDYELKNLFTKGRPKTIEEIING